MDVQIYNNIVEGKYRTKLPWPELTTKAPSITNEPVRAARRAHRVDADRLEQVVFKQDLFKAYGVIGNPKADRCFEIAFGHACGLSEVAEYFDELVELIK